MKTNRRRNIKNKIINIDNRNKNKICNKKAMGNNKFKFRIRMDNAPK